METSFLVKPEKWNKYYPKQFSSSSEPYSAKLFWCFEAFLRKLTENIFFKSKNRLSQKEAKNYAEFFFLNKFERGRILSKSFDKLTEKIFFKSKNRLSQKEAKNYAEIFFLDKFERGGILSKSFD